LVSVANAKNDPPRYGDGSGLDDGPLLPGRPRRQKGHVVAEPEQVTEAQEDALGQDIDKLDNLAHALLLPMPADFHTKQMKSSLPELVREMKKHFAEAFGWNPWEFHPE
jgi:hypothetical protein